MKDDNGERLRWFVFHCTRATEFACLERLVFATHDNATNRKKVKKIRAETELYLFNVDTKKTHGRFFPQGQPGVIDAELFGGQFKLQQKVVRTAVVEGAFRLLRFGPQTHEPPLHAPVLTPAQLFAAAGGRVLRENITSVAPEVSVQVLESGWDCGEVETKQEVETETKQEKTEEREDLLLLDLSSEMVELNSKKRGLDFFELQVFLKQVGLERYQKNFEDAEVDMDLVRTLSEDDMMKYLRIPFGPARIIKRAIEDSASSVSSLSSDLQLLQFSEAT